MSIISSSSQPLLEATATATATATTARPVIHPTQPTWMTSKMQLVKQLANHIPVTDAGLPEYLIRPDMLPAIDTISELQADEAEAAKVSISYIQGYPTFTDSEQPLWFQASYEPDDTFEAFNTYLIAGVETGFRNLDTKIYVRATEWFYLYFWAARSRAYDLFRRAASTQLASERQITMSDSHFTKGEILLQRAYDKLIDPEEYLAPRETIELAKLGASLQRGAIEHKVGGSGVKATIDIKTIVASTNQPEAFIVDRALSDPESASILQQVMIKLYRGET